MDYLLVASFLLLIAFIGLGYFVFSFLFIGNIYKLKYDTRIITPTERMEERNNSAIEREAMLATIKLLETKYEELSKLHDELKNENNSLSKQVEKLVIARVKQ